MFHPAPFLAIFFAIFSAEFGKPNNSEKPLFDGKSLDGWKKTEFGGEGEVNVEAGEIILDLGNDMTGITWTKDFPKNNYEISLEARRLDGHDFFCGLTFPVGDHPLTLIVGGWGGSVVGLSNIDGQNASENDTTSYQDFDSNKWYKIRLRVEKETVRVWINDKQVIDQDVKGKRLTIRGECEASRPLGFATWRTKAGLRNIKLMDLSTKK